MNKHGFIILSVIILFSCEEEPQAPPEALFRCRRQAIEINEVIRFLNRSKRAVQHTWEFGDGDTSNLVNPSHFYTHEGEYRVRLSVSNSLGSDDTSRIIRVIRPDVLWPAPGSYSGFSDRNGSIEIHITGRQIDKFEGSFYALIAAELYELNASFEFGQMSKTDTGFIARNSDHILTGIFHNDTITGIWKHGYGKETFRVIRE